MKHYDAQSGYDLYASDYRKDHAHLDSFDWQLAQPLLVKMVENQLSRHDSIRLLDLGCGDGRILKRLARLCEQRSWQDRVELHGWDISEGMLRQARKALPASVRLRRCDLRERAPNQTVFHCVCSFFVLVHIDDPGDFLGAASQLLGPGGQFLFNNIPQRQALVLENAGHKFQIDYAHHEDQAILDNIAESGLSLSQEIAGEWSRLFLAEKPQ